MNADLKLPSAGKGRFWLIKHQPNSTTKPLRIELREKTIPSSTEIVPSLSRLISFEGSVADEDAVRETMTRILARASRVDEFVGVHS